MPNVLPSLGRLQINPRLTRQSNALTALLPMFETVPSDGQKNALRYCPELATDVSVDPSALIGGAG